MQTSSRMKDIMCKFTSRIISLLNFLLHCIKKSMLSAIKQLVNRILINSQRNPEQKLRDTKIHPLKKLNFLDICIRKKKFVKEEYIKQENTGII